MSQTREDRIRAHFRALKLKHEGYLKGEGVSSLLMTMAQHWKTPIRELREILGLPARLPNRQSPERRWTPMNHGRGPYKDHGEWVY